MGLWKSLAGVFSIEMISASPAEMLTAINDNGITVFDIVQTGDLSVKGNIYRSDYIRMEKLLARRGEEMKIIQKKGVFWTIAGLRKRPVLLVALAIYMVLIFYLPTRVLFVRVEGNQTVSAIKILEEAENCGIYFGASRREVRSERMKNALLAAVPQLQWAGVNTVGCVAVISVQERSIAPENGVTGGVSSIVAKCDGVIQELTVLRGNALCKVGQAVKAGQVLVSGYTDCGITVKAETAEAEVYAETRHALEVITPVLFDERMVQIREETNYSLLIGKKLINLFKGSGISDSSCVKMYKKYDLTLPGDFRLPVGLITEHYFFYDQQSTSESDENAFSWVKCQSEEYLLEQMLAGKILETELVTQLRADVFYQYGEYACLEMIGQVHSEEILQGNGKRN